jgi:fatty acid desaturase
MIALTGAVLAALLWFRPVAALLLFVAPMVTSLLAVSWATYSHHAGIDAANHFEASNNTMHPLYNILTGNLGYHTAHHYRQGVHWSKLPELHAKIAAQIPENRYLPPSFPLSLVMTPRADELSS